MSNENTTDPKKVSAGSDTKNQSVEALRAKVAVQAPAVSAGVDDPSGQTVKVRHEAIEGLAHGVSAGGTDPGNQSVKTHRDPVEGLAKGISAAGGTGNQGTGEQEPRNELKDQHLA